MTTSASSKTAVVNATASRKLSGPIVCFFVGLAITVAGIWHASPVVGSIGATMFLASVLYLASAVLNPRFIPGKLLSVRIKQK